VVEDVVGGACSRVVVGGEAACARVVVEVVDELVDDVTVDDVDANVKVVVVSEDDAAMHPHKRMVEITADTATRTLPAFTFRRPPSS
jgi:dissimilatory sulfite reductase (desulfoviridin) alpha/beta subunit